MIFGLFAFYEGFVALGIIAGIAFIFYSDRFLVIHREFLLMIAAGAGISIFAQVGYLFSWPSGLQMAHLVFIISIVIGLLFLINSRKRSASATEDLS